MKRAFVTGGTGFLGRRIVGRLIERGYEVRVLVRDEAKVRVVEDLGAEVVIGDLAEIEAFEAALDGCELVFLAGARAVSHGEWRDFLQANIVATEKLIDAAVAAGAKRIVYVSSLGIFEIPRDGVTIGEETEYDHQPLLRGHYTRSKIDGDRVARAAIAAGKPVVVIRPGRIYGHDHPLQQPLYLGRVKKRIGSRILLVVGKRSYLTPICYVENAADAIVAAGTVDGVDTGIFNIVDDPDLCHAEYFRAVSAVGGCPRAVFFLPVGLFVPALIAVDVLFRLLKRRRWAVAYQLRRSGRSARYATDAARDRLGWSPRFDLRQAVEATVSGCGG